MTRRDFLGGLPLGGASPTAWGGWRAEAWAVADLPVGQIEVRLRARHTVTGRVRENAVRVAPVEGGTLRDDERQRALALGRAMLADWLRRQNGVPP